MRILSSLPGIKHIYSFTSLGVHFNEDHLYQEPNTDIHWHWCTLGNQSIILFTWTQHWCNQEANVIILTTWTQTAESDCHLGADQQPERSSACLLLERPEALHYCCRVIYPGSLPCLPPCTQPFHEEQSPPQVLEIDKWIFKGSLSNQTVQMKSHILSCIQLKSFNSLSSKFDITTFLLNYLDDQIQLS